MDPCDRESATRRMTTAEREHWPIQNAPLSNGRDGEPWTLPPAPAERSEARQLVVLGVACVKTR